MVDFTKPLILPSNPRPKNVRDADSLKFLQDELTLVHHTYPNLIKITSIPTILNPGQFLLNLKNEFNDEFKLALNLKVSISLDYPNGDFEFELIDFMGMDSKKAGKFITKIKNRADLLGAMGEGGVMEIAKVSVREMEEYEDHKEKALKRKNLFEIRLEEQEKKRLAEEK